MSTRQNANNQFFGIDNANNFKGECGCIDEFFLWEILSLDIMPDWMPQEICNAMNDSKIMKEFNYLESLKLQSIHPIHEFMKGSGRYHMTIYFICRIKPADLTGKLKFRMALTRELNKLQDNHDEIEKLIPLSAFYMFWLIRTIKGKPDIKSLVKFHKEIVKENADIFNIAKVA